jgi:hypothetical protein
LIVLDPLLSNVDRAARDEITLTREVVTNDARPVERSAAKELLYSVSANDEIF